MIVNKKLLQFYSFNLNKKINNLVKKNSEKTLEYLFDDELEKLFCFVENECEKENIIIQLSNCHEIEGNNKDLLIKIIKECYEDLCNLLLQEFESSDKTSVFNNINFYQCAINTRSRLIFIVKQDEFIPIIFDLKHVIYPISDRNFDNNSKQEIYRWSYRYKNKKVEIGK